MQREMKKVTLIVNEILNVLFGNGPIDVDVKIKQFDTETEVIIKQHECKYKDAFIEKLHFDLETQRQTEVEGYYWQLVGENESCEELHLVGAMIDTAEVKYDEGELYIRIVRKKSH